MRDYRLEQIGRLDTATFYRQSPMTAEGKAGAWSTYTEEQTRAQASLIDLRVEIVPTTAVVGFDDRRAELACVYAGATRTSASSSMVVVASREPRTDLYRDLPDADGTGPAAGMSTILRAGDCVQPSIIATAIYIGHRVGWQIGASGVNDSPQCDRVVVELRQKKASTSSFI